MNDQKGSDQRNSKSMVKPEICRVNGYSKSQTHEKQRNCCRKVSELENTKQWLSMTYILNMDIHTDHTNQKQCSGLEKQQNFIINFVVYRDIHSHQTNSEQ
jgi:hypothetical protein